MQCASKGVEFMEKTALVTGGTRGIGSSISKALKDVGYTVIANYASNDDSAKKFSDEGAKIIMVDINAKLLKKESKSLHQDYFIADISKANNFLLLRNYIYKKYKKLDIVVNNAGVTKDN